MDPITFISKNADRTLFVRSSTEIERFEKGVKVWQMPQEEICLHTYEYKMKGRSVVVKLIRDVNEDIIERDGVRSSLREAKFIDRASGRFVIILSGISGRKFVLDLITMKRYAVAMTSYDVSNTGSVLYTDRHHRQMVKVLGGKGMALVSQDRYHAFYGNRLLSLTIKPLVVNNDSAYYIDGDKIVARML